MVEQKYTTDEKEYYQAVVEKKAEEIHRASTHEEVEKIMDGVLKSDEIHRDLLLRFRRDVERRVEDFKRSQADAREKNVVEEFEGFVKTVDGKFMPTGVDRKFKVRVHPSASLLKFWRVGEIAERVFGKSVDGGEFHKIIEEVQKLDEEIQELQRDIDLLKTSRKSCTKLLGMCASGFLAKLSSRGVGGIGEAAEESAKELSESYDEKREEKKELKKAEKTVKEKMKEMEKKKDLREKTIEKVRQLREKGKERFDKYFMEEVQYLISNKEKMKPGEYDRRMKKLRDKVGKDSKRSGFTHMEVFLEDALKERGMEAPPPDSDLENKKKRALVSKWINESMGFRPSSEQTDMFLREMSKEPNRKYLDDILENKGNDYSGVLKFFFRGEYGKARLPAERRAPADFDSLRLLMARLSDYLKHKDKLEGIFATFAGDAWKEYKAVDFDDAFDRLLRNQPPPGNEAAKKDLKAEFVAQIMVPARAFWKSATGSEPNETQLNEFMTRFDNDKYRNKAKKILSNSTLAMYARFFFTGEFDGKPLVANVDRFIDENVDAVFSAVETSMNISDLPPEDIAYANKAFASQRGRNLSELTPSVYDELLKGKALEMERINSLRNALQLHSKPELTRELYDTYKGDPAWLTYLDRDTTRDKLRFLIDGSFDLDEDHKLEIRGIRMTDKARGPLRDILGNLKLLDKISSADFFSKADEFFRDPKGKTMSMFLTHLLKEYKNST